MWQHLDIIIWNIFPFYSNSKNFIISFIVFWFFMLLDFFHVLFNLDFLEFIGISQVLFDNQLINHRTAGMSKLQTHGFYKYVRHPIYTLTIFAFLLTPGLYIKKFKKIKFIY